MLLAVAADQTRPDQHQLNKKVRFTKKQSVKD